MAGHVPGIHVLASWTKTWMPGTSPGTTEPIRATMLDALNYTPRDETSIRYDGWRIVVVCFLLATFGWGLGFYGQSVYVAELQRLHGWPASLISSGTTFFYLFGAALVAFVSEAHQGVRPAQLPGRGNVRDGRRRDLDRSGARTLAALPRQCRARLRLGGDQPRHHHQHAGPLVRQEARHGDQPGAERREFWRHRRRAAADHGDRPFRLFRRDDRRLPW